METATLYTTVSATDKAQVRATVFGHLSGIVIAPVVKALLDRRVFEMFDDAEWVAADSIVSQTRANRGYLLVALRLLTSYGWLERRGAEFRLTHEGITSLRIAAPLYEEVVPFLSTSIFLDEFLFAKPHGPMPPSLQLLVPKVRSRWSLPELLHDAPAIAEKVCLQLDGLVVGPCVVALARAGVLDQLSRGPVEVKALPGNQSVMSVVLDLLATLGWVSRERNTVRLTPVGSYAAEIAASYGVTVSYIPLFTVVSSLLFGNARIPRMDESGAEIFVNRAMNVWGSGGAHKNYFKKVDEIVIELFNRPIEQQPRGICDMGCGDGTLLDHLYSVVKSQTRRGEVLDEYPLMMVGADFNKVARRITTQRLRKAGIPSFHVIHGDINRPAQLAGDLEKLNHDIHDLLHVRSFLDHNRPFTAPFEYRKGSRAARTTGAFAHLGEEIPADELEENLVRHLRRWAPYVGRFGLLLIELHTVPPPLVAANLDKTPAVAYDGTHGFSDQYLVELPVFLECAKEAGLTANPRFAAKYPQSDLATVSINIFAAPQ
jgi:hypothetical protein